MTLEQLLQIEDPGPEYIPDEHLLQVDDALKLAVPDGHNSHESPPNEYMPDAQATHPVADADGR